MDKQNEKTVKNNETMELTPDQMSMISGGTGSEGKEYYNCPMCGAMLLGDSQYSSHLKSCLGFFDPDIHVSQPGPNPSPDPQPAPVSDPHPRPFK